MKAEELAGCAIVCADALLLVHRAESGLKQWELPGGRVLWQESHEQAAVRKVHEQLGVSAIVGTCLGDWEFRQKRNLFHSTVFRARISGDAAPQLRQPVHDCYEFFGRRALKHMEDDLSPNVQILLKRLTDGEVQLAIA